MNTGKLYLAVQKVDMRQNRAGILARFVQETATQKRVFLQEQISLCIRPKPRWMPAKLWVRLVMWVLKVDYEQVSGAMA